MLKKASQKCTLRDKFKGCLVGALLGDCLGAVLEHVYVDAIGEDVVLREVGLSQMAAKKKESFKYTDDSAMTISVCESLIDKKSFDAADLAKRFIAKYTTEPDRGYGRGMFGLFDKWKVQQNVSDNVYQAAREQFNGTGSYGNGAAMRISPVALFAISEEEVIEVAKQNALLTHTNKHGYHGAILQALAVHRILHDDSTTFNGDAFVTGLMKTMGDVLQHDAGKETKSGVATRWRKRHTNKSNDFSFVSQLEKMRHMLAATTSGTDDRCEVVKILGNDITAQQAVPAALYSFAKFAAACSFEDVLQFAIGLGGDTDTIASMACALAGAHTGYANIPSEWIRVCESSDTVAAYADDLFTLYCIRTESGSCS